MSKNRARPKSRLFGWSEIWRYDSTGTRTFFLFCVPIFTRNFYHSTWMEP